MPVNFVLIDYENIQPELNKLDRLNCDNFNIVVFLGQKQTISVELANALQGFGSKARYVQISGNGKNALDFHIAFYLGRLSFESPDRQFYVISKDTGYDPLILYLNSKQAIQARRLRDIGKIPKVAFATSPGKESVYQASRPPDPAPKEPDTIVLQSTVESAQKPALFNIEEKFQKISHSLRKNPEKNPKTVNGLNNWIKTSCATSAEPNPAAKVKKIIKLLQDNGLIKLNGLKVEYFVGIDCPEGGT